MDLYVFADERKRVLERWDYLAIAAVPYAHGRGLYEDLQRERKRAGFHGEMKFARLHKKGIGSRVDTAKGWLRLVVDDARCANRRLFISITGIDNSQLDFHLFGPNGSPTASYANVYNRFFRASLLGLLNYCFPSQAISVRDVFHDSEGNLQNHKYFEWRVIQEISRREPRISFQKDKVTFVRSDPRLEKAHPRASEIVQLVDLILGTVTYAIHITNRSNRGQLECAKLALPWITEILSDPYAARGKYDQLRRFSIVHFPRNRQNELIESTIPGEYFCPAIGPIDELAYGQTTLGI
jgi:hypothetical protein